MWHAKHHLAAVLACLDNLVCCASDTSDGSTLRLACSNGVDLTVLCTLQQSIGAC